MRSQIFVPMLVALLVWPGLALAKSFQIDSEHSSVEFSVRHLVSRTGGRFNDFSGTIEFDRDMLAEGEGRVEVKIDAASIDTDNEDRDEHLRSEDFLAVQEFPQITFLGETVGKTEDGFDVAGKLTIRGITKEVVLPVEFLGLAPDPWGSTRAGFATELTINRKDFGVNWNKALDQGGFILGDDVRIRISVEAVHQAEEASES